MDSVCGVWLTGLAMSVAIAAIAGASFSANGVPVNVGPQKQLFVDDYVIERMDGVKQVLNQPKKYPGNPVLRPDKPWEWPRVFLDGSVIFDKELFKIWYYSISANGAHGCYAESKDGIHWEKPNLGVVEFQGSKENNLIPWFALGVVYSPDDPDPSKRYKTLGGGTGAGNRGARLLMLRSKT